VPEGHRGLHDFLYGEGVAHAVGEAAQTAVFTRDMEHQVGGCGAGCLLDRG
jgi:hypothetical protein